ncbi:MAG: hypothetical protein K1W20_04985 [Lachnospiraceae bacterium]
MRRETEKRYKKICELRKAGKSRQEIMKAVHCSMSTIDLAIRILGEKAKRESFEDHKAEIVEMWQAGETLERIAEETGISITTINRRLLGMGLSRGKGWKKGQEMRKVRKPISHREQAERTEGPEIGPIQYADNTRRSETVVIRGKTYQDVSAWYM